METKHAHTRGKGTDANTRSDLESSCKGFVSFDPLQRLCVGRFQPETLFAYARAPATRHCCLAALHFTGKMRRLPTVIPGKMWSLTPNAALIILD